MTLPLILTLGLLVLLGLGWHAGVGLLPLVFLWYFVGRPSRRRWRAQCPDQSRETLPATDHADRADLEARVRQLELELVTARREARELRDQLTWNARLLAAQDEHPASTERPAGQTSAAAEHEPS